MRHDELTVEVGTVALVPLVSCAGLLTIGSASRLGGILSKVLLDTGRLLVAVDGLALTSTARVALFPTVLAKAGGWPDARMVLSGSPDCAVARAMRLTGGAREVPLAADAAEGLAALGRRPARVRRSTTLPAAVEAPGFARVLLRLAADDWVLPPELRDRAVAVVNELTSNAVQHARGPAELILTVDEAGLRIAVRDRSAFHPPTSEGWGSGLHLVSRLSDAHGVTPHLHDKTVWAMLRR